MKYAFKAMILVGVLLMTVSHLAQVIIRHHRPQVKVGQKWKAVSENPFEPDNTIREVLSISNGYILYRVTWENGKSVECSTPESWFSAMGKPE